MPLYQMDIQKRYNPSHVADQQVYWTNSYYYQCANRTEADALVLALTLIERACLVDPTEYDRERVCVFNGAISDCGTQGAGATGLLTSSESVLNLDNVALITGYGANGSVRRIYWRGPMRDEDYVGTFLTSTYRTFLQDNYVAPLLAAGDMRTRSGSPVVALEVGAWVSLHQMRRGTRRTHTPIL